MIPCGCSQKTGTVRRTLRDMFGEIEKEHPFLKETMLSAMSKIDTARLLDTRFLNLDGKSEQHEQLQANEQDSSLVSILS